jgi:hypothetical protein
MLTKACSSFTQEIALHSSINMLSRSIVSRYLYTCMISYLAAQCSMCVALQHACLPLGPVLLAPKRTLLLRSFVAVNVDSLPLYSAIPDSGTVITLLLLQGCNNTRHNAQFSVLLLRLRLQVSMRSGSLVGTVIECYMLHILHRVSESVHTYLEL